MAEIDYIHEECAMLRINLVSLAKKEPSCSLSPRNHTFDPDGDVTLIFPRASFKNIPYSRLMVAKCGIALPMVGEARYLVSSKHLSLASPVFKAMLSGGFSEGDALRTYGRVEISLPEDCHEAFGVIMDVIHGRPHLAPGPKRASPKLLANLAILLDKYQFAPIFEHFKSSWFEELDGDCNFCANDRTMLSFFGSCVGFKYEEKYLRAHLKVAWPYYKGALPAYFPSRNPILNKLPIPTLPNGILVCLRYTRLRAFKEMFRMIDGYITGLGCDRYCFCVSKCRNFGKERERLSTIFTETCNDRLHLRLIVEATRAGLWHLESENSEDSEDSDTLNKELYKDLSFEGIKSRILAFDLTIDGCDAGRRCKDRLVEEMEEIEDRCDGQECQYLPLT